MMQVAGRPSFIRTIRHPCTSAAKAGAGKAGVRRRPAIANRAPSKFLIVDLPLHLRTGHTPAPPALYRGHANNGLVLAHNLGTAKLFNSQNGINGRFTRRRFESILGVSR